MNVFTMKGELEEFMCPRCGYHTSKKALMKRHLYEKQRPCAKLVNDIELTDEIKQCVLENRVYQVAVSREMQVENFNNLIKTLAIELIEQSKLNTFRMSTDDVCKIVNEMSQLDSQAIQDPYYYAYKIKRRSSIPIFEYMKLRNKCAIKMIVFSMKSKYTNGYERFLIDGIKSEDALNRREYEERLREYYKFLAATEVLPGVKDTYPTDGIDLLEDSIKREYIELYKNILDQLTGGEIQDIKKAIVDVLQENASESIESLGVRFLDIFRIDEEFKRGKLGNRG